MKKPLLSQVCHDLRAPLAAVTMGAGFVLQTTKDDPRSQRVVEAMLRSCRQMERLIRALSDLSEIESNALELDRGRHDAAAIVELVLDAVVTEKDLELTSSVPEAPLSIDVDTDRIKRALGHLVTNAVEHAPESTTIALEVEARDGKVVFTVRDRGPGPEAETLAHLFDREWHRAHPKRSGSGFGLAIARGFALAHGGDLVFARRDDQSIFELSIPL